MSRRVAQLGLVVALAGGCAHTAPPPPLPHRDVYLGAIPQAVVGAVPFRRAELQGQVVLVTFIATWCFPCLADLASLDALQKEFGGRGFTQVLVALDLDGPKVLEPFASAYQLRYPLIAGDDRLRSGATPFGLIKELPSRVLFDRSGQPVLAYSGVIEPAELARRVRAALDAP